MCLSSLCRCVQCSTGQNRVSTERRAAALHPPFSAPGTRPVSFSTKLPSPRSAAVFSIGALAVPSIGSAHRFRNQKRPVSFSTKPPMPRIATSSVPERHRFQYRGRSPFPASKAPRALLHEAALAPNQRRFLPRGRGFARSGARRGPECGQISRICPRPLTWLSKTSRIRMLS